MKPFRSVPAVAIAVLGLCVATPFFGQMELPPEERLSEATADCLTCHEVVTPGIVADWLRSRHAQTTPTEGMAKARLERRVSATSIDEPLRDVVVGCFECHSRNLEAHTDRFEHEGYEISVVVSPPDCATCHPTEWDEYQGSKKSEALAILRKNPVYHALSQTLTTASTVAQGQVSHLGSSEGTRNEACYGCHGTEVKVRGMKTIETEYGDYEVPDLTNWPNQGVGRLNPDGSRGACTSCHPRHGFSIEMARKPHTCAQCHLEPDVPATEVYRESKHGNIFLTEGDDWTWDSVPWVLGVDFRAPTCATCHASLVTSPDGEVIAERSHDFSSRLWVRIFGLPYSHPQPKSGATHAIRNPDGVAMPVTFDGRLATDYLIDEAEQARRKKKMTQVCLGCHGTSWTDGFFAKLDHTLAETDGMVAAATHLMQRAWELGLADDGNPFDESLERKWMLQWLFYANSVRYASAMSGPDYATFKNGWWALTKNLAELEEAVAKAEQATEEDPKGDQP